MVVAWGLNNFGQCTVPPPNSGFVAIAAGQQFSLGIKSDGTIIGWGYNNHGQCNPSQPNSGFVSVSAGYAHGMGLRLHPAGVRDEVTGATGVTLLPNHPNPFQPTTTIRFELLDARWALLQVYDIQGHLVRTLVSGPVSPGRHEMTWDGSSDQGRVVPAGVYLCRLQARGVERTRSMVLTR